MTSPFVSPASSATRRPDAFRLTGPTVALDPRTHAYRNDLADIALAGARFAPHYARAEPCSIAAPAVPVLAAPSAEAQAVSQLLQGEGFALLDRSGAWAWGRCAHDDYVGYVRADALGPPISPDWRVTVAGALAFASGSIKAPVVARYPLGALLSGVEAGEFVRVDGCFVHRRHLAPVKDRASDWVAAAERFVGMPYLWGGRGGGGIDCSGLVQAALGFAGIASPRDSDQQRDALGSPLDAGAPCERGDLVFVPGHVGIMVDGVRLLHANAHWMAVSIEPLAEMLGRLAATVEPVRRRLAP